MKKFLSYLEGRDWLFTAIFVVLVYLQVILTLMIPEYMSGITTMMQSANGDLGLLVEPAVKMLLCSIGAVLSAVGSNYFLSVTSATIIMRMRKDLFSTLMSFSLPETKRFSTSSLITRCTNDVEQVRTFLSTGVAAIVQAPMMLVIAISKMSGNEVWMTAVIVVALVLAISTIVLFLLSLSKTNRVQKLIDVINRLTKEHLTGMRVVHAYNGYEYQRSQFEEVNDDLTRTNVGASRLVGAVMPIYNLCLNGLTLIVYILGSYMIYQLGEAAKQQELFSEMVVFSSYALQAFSAFAIIIVVIALLPRMVISFRRVNEVTTTVPQIQDGIATGGANGKVGTIEFRNVSFTYPGAAEKALTDISFTVDRGQTLAIIGSTGSGKTTLLNLIMRFYDVTEGSVFVDGRDVRDYNLWSLRDMMGYVPQKSFLFSGTIGTNIDYGNKSGLENTLAEIRHAAEVGQSREFIEQKSGAYEARVEEGGSNFSGGQRQRLTISRAICRDPEFYLFDDSFSALDYKTDSVLRRRLRENAKDATQIIVGQRVGSIMNADKIIVIDKGRIVGQGVHDELLASCEVYREIAASQLMSEE